MEEYSDRRSKTEIAFVSRGSRMSSTNQSHQERTDDDNYGPRRITKFDHMKTGMANNPERPKYLCDSSKSSSSKVLPSSSSKFPLRKFEEKRRHLLAGVDNVEINRRKAKAKHLEDSMKIVAENENSITLQTEPEGFTTNRGHWLASDPECSQFAGPSGVPACKVDSLVRSASQISRMERQKGKEVNLGTPGACSSSFKNRYTVPSTSYSHSVQSRGPKNLSSTSAPDVQPSGCTSDSVYNRRLEVIRKRASDGENSFRSRSLNGPFISVHSPPTYIRDTDARIRISEQSHSQQIIRRSSRNYQDSAVSVRTRRSYPHDTRLSVPDERADDVVSLHGSSTMNGQSDQEHVSLEETSAESSIRPFFVELPHEIYSSSRRSSNTWTERRRPSSLFVESPPQMFQGLLGERDSRRHISMERITEALVVLERIEQEAELTYEQLLVLESNLLLGSFATYDQHRGMRMDIDNMTYEELLALEERIGSVSTALSEEQLSKCLRRSIYGPVATEVNKSVTDDMKCSICQEEFMEGEEVGRLPCEHRYHVCCIGQWLMRQKSWCPVCKASAI